MSERDPATPAFVTAAAPSHWQLPAGTWPTVLDALCERFPAIDRAQWLDRMARGRVHFDDGEWVTAATPYRVGRVLRYFREVAQESRIPFEERVLHMDEHLVVVDKPHYLPVTPSGGYVNETLLARLVQRLGQPELVPLHRLDRLTAGLVLFSAKPATRDAYQSLFRERRIAKTYEAIAPALPEATFPLVRRSRIERGEPFFRMCEVPGEPNSETRIEVIERGNDGWRYRLQPVTGRKHQLRVHMAALGAPIANDPLYPDLMPATSDDTHPLKLLARGLSFVDPLSGEPRTFTSTQAL